MTKKNLPVKHNKYIVRNPEIMGGEPTIIGTRIPIARVLFLLTENYTIECIAKEYAIDEKLIKRAIFELSGIGLNEENVKTPRKI